MQADKILVGAALSTFQPPPLLLPSEFAESELFLPASSNARPGPLRLTPYQRGIIDTFADPKISTLVMCASAQVGKSLITDCLVAYAVAQQPAPILCVLPTWGNAETWMRDRLDPLIKASPALRALIGVGGRKGSGDSNSYKIFPGGSLNLASSHQPDTLAAKAVRYLFMDEIDRYVLTTIEGEPSSLALKRTRTFDNRKVVICSTPTSRVGSRIATWFSNGDQRRWHVSCPDCGHSAPIIFEQLHWPEDKPEDAYLTCDQCGCVHDELARRKMVESGAWIATAKGEPGVASFHISELASPFSSLESVARQYIKAKAEDQLRVFNNVVLGLTYDSDIDIELDAEVLQAGAITIAPPYANDILAVTAGVDVQNDRCEVSFLAHHADQTWSVLNHLVLGGDTTAPNVWSDLDEALGATFRLQDGRVLPLAATAVDSGNMQTVVAKFVITQRKKARRCYAVKGASRNDGPIIKEGARLQGVMKQLMLNVSDIKISVSKRLKDGTIRLPNHLDSAYFGMLSSEELRTKYVRGYPKQEWFRKSRNEAFDCLVYATALASLPNIFTASRPTPSNEPPRKSIAEQAAALNALHNTGAKQRNISYG